MVLTSSTVTLPELTPFASSENWPITVGRGTCTFAGNATSPKFTYGRIQSNKKTENVRMCFSLQWCLKRLDPQKQGEKPTLQDNDKDWPIQGQRRGFDLYIVRPTGIYSITFTGDWTYRPNCNSNCKLEDEERGSILHRTKLDGDSWLDVYVAVKATSEHTQEAIMVTQSANFSISCKRTVRREV